jgi:hypothetical protein
MSVLQKVVKMSENTIIDINEETIYISKNKCNDFKSACIQILKHYFETYTIDDVNPSRNMIITNYNDGIMYYLRTWNITETDKKIKILYSLNKFYDD